MIKGICRQIEIKLRESQANWVRLEMVCTTENLYPGIVQGHIRVMNVTAQLS